MERESERDSSVTEGLLQDLAWKDQLRQYFRKLSKILRRSQISTLGNWKENQRDHAAFMQV